MTNQPVHHVLYMFIKAGCPTEAQYWIRETLLRLYGSDFFPGDEDNGEMAAWFTLSAMGLYSLIPGTTAYLLGAPLFGGMRIQLPAGAFLNSISAGERSAAAVYVQSVEWNGQKLAALELDYNSIMQGGNLTFVMGSAPSSTYNLSPK
jgi:putative alpha-1,2-mannosidase